MKISTIDHSLGITSRKFSIRIGTRNDLSGHPPGAYFYWHPSYDPNEISTYAFRKGKRGWSIGIAFYFPWKWSQKLPLRKVVLFRGTA